jgi:chloride channel protein, CIC family
MRVPEALSKAVSRLQGWRVSEERIYLALSLFIGALVGLVVVAFIIVTEHLGSQMYPPGGSAWRRVVVPVTGAFVTGFLLYRFFPAARGSGIPQTKTAMLLHGGYINLPTVLGRFVCSSAALASGIALGREGPSVQIGGGIASIIARRIGLGPARVRSLIPVGAAAAVSAAFNTPIAGVLFALEEVMGDLHAPVLGSTVLASATAWVVLHLLLGDEPLFHVPQYELANPLEFLVYAVLGIAGGFCSIAFVKLTLGLRARFLTLPKSTRWAHPVAGGLVVGILGIWTPQVLGVGYDYVGQVLNGEITLRFVATLLALKLVATAACYASGNTGGIFGPSLFLGAMLGATVGAIAREVLPGITANAGAYALVGMGATFAGIIRVPLTSVFMIFELTRDYSVIVPLMISNLISFAISRRLQPVPVYEALALQDGVHLPRAARDRAEPGIPVSKIMFLDAPVLPASTLVRDVPRDSPACVFRRDGAPAAALSQPEIARALETGDSAVPVATLFENRTNVAHVHPDHSLEDALERMYEAEAEALAVVERADITRVRGVVTIEALRQAFGVR